MKKDLDLQKANVSASLAEDESIPAQPTWPSRDRKCLLERRENRPTVASHPRSSRDRSPPGLTAAAKRALAMLSFSDVQMELPPQSQISARRYRRAIDPIRVNRGFCSRTARRLNQLRLEIQLIPFRIRYIARRMKLGSWLSSCWGSGKSDRTEKLQSGL